MFRVRDRINEVIKKDILRRFRDKDAFHLLDDEKIAEAMILAGKRWLIYDMSERVRNLYNA